MTELRIAIDVGGTFTDAIACDTAGHLRTAKIRTRPDALAAGVLAAIAEICAHYAPEQPLLSHLLYGTTLATNALLEHRLPRIALLVTAGFREILEINDVHDEDHHEPGAHRHARPRLVSLEDIYEVNERIERDGRIRVALDDAQIARLAIQILASGRSIVAVALLHSYLAADHEQRIREIIARSAPGLRVVLSSDVLPELREYERTVVTCLNAALLPVMQDHLQQLQSHLSTKLLLMKSSGGLGSADNALRAPLTTALSGPSAAVLCACQLARELALPRAISLDIGGTSMDIALLENGAYRAITNAEIAGYPLKTPAVDLLTMGAGGGSLARHGTDQRWRVGPQSAGAVPGPACYGLGGEIATLTDAHLVLGRLPNQLLEGVVPLDRARALQALSEFGAPRGLDPIRTACGLLRIASFAMCGAIRRLAARRGQASESHALIALGGAGPLHAAELARLLGIRTVVIPPTPGLAAAFGLLTGAMREDAVQTYTQAESALDVTGSATHFARLEAQVSGLLAASGFASDQMMLSRTVDIRYVGMSSEFTVPLASGALSKALLQEAIAAFHDIYETFSGRAYRGPQPVEIINLRVTGTVDLPPPPRIQLPRAPAAPRPCDTRAVYFLDAAAAVPTPIYRRADLGADTMLRGPVIVEQFDTTVLVPPDFTLHCDGSGNLLLMPTR